MDRFDPGARVRLVRCLVVNAAGQLGFRYVELDHYKLWEYLVLREHRLTVRQAWLVLWCPEAEFQHHASTFEHAGDVERVDRIHIDIFDAHHHYTLGIDRYARQADIPYVRDILLKHMSADQSRNGQWQLAHIPGRGVITSQIDPAHPAVLGLTGETPTHPPDDASEPATS